MKGKPSIAVWIDAATQEAKTDFELQALQPAEYGVVISLVITHIARTFGLCNPQVSEEELIGAVLTGIQAGLAQRPPPTSMVPH